MINGDTICGLNGSIIILLPNCSVAVLNCMADVFLLQLNFAHYSWLVMKTACVMFLSIKRGFSFHCSTIEKEYMPTALCGFCITLHLAGTVLLLQLIITLKLTLTYIHRA